MKAESLLEVIGGIEDSFIVSAQNRLEEAEGIWEQRKAAKYGSGYRKALLAAAAVFLVLLSSFTVAMAASEEFRSAVFRFFHIFEPIAAPNPEQDTDPQETVGIVGSMLAVTVKLSSGAQTEYGCYPLLYNLKTREAVDVLKDCEEVRGQNIIEAEFSPDLSKILVTCGENVMWYDEYSSAVYCYDIEKKDWKALSGLCEMNVMGAWFIDEDTVGCIWHDSEYHYTLRTLTLFDGKYFQGFSDMPGSDWSEDGRGISFNSSRYGLLVTEEGDVRVYDFKTGEKTLVEGLEYSADFSAGSFNRDGMKLLFSETGGREDVWVVRIGILDLEKKTFVSFEREGDGAPREYSVSWFDRERVGVEAAAGEDWYLYLFRAEAPEE